MPCFTQLNFFTETNYMISDLDLRKLLPTLDHYITYEGSLTEPPCQETVQWILLNKPIYATFKQWSALINSSYAEGYANNFRPIQSTNYRCIRTNIWKKADNRMRQVSCLSDQGDILFNCFN